MEFLTQGLNRILATGPDLDQSNTDRLLRRVFIRIMIVILIASTISIINELVQGNPKGTLFNAIFIVIELVLLWIGYIGKHRMAAFILCSFLPICVTLLSIAYSDVRNLAFYLSVFTLITFYYIENSTLKTSLILLQLACFLFSTYYQYHFEPLLGFSFSPTSNFGIGLVFILVFVTICQILVTQIKLNEKALEANINSLKEKKTELESANKQLEKYSEVVSHDLKSPLRSIHSFIGLIERRISSGKLDDLHDLTNQVKSNAEKMKSMIDDALTFNLSNLTEKELSSINLKELVQKIEKDMESSYTNFSIKVYVKSPFYCIESAIYKVLQNLIENGLKYNDSDKKEIIVSQELKKSEMIITVEDNGIGIVNSEVDKVFDMYYRVDNGLELEGSGIGLAICKTELAKIDGQISIDRDYHGGSKFKIQIPRNQFTFSKP